MSFRTLRVSNPGAPRDLSHPDAPLFANLSPRTRAIRLTHAITTDASIPAAPPILRRPAPALRRRGTHCEGGDPQIDRLYGGGGVWAFFGPPPRPPPPPPAAP